MRDLVPIDPNENRNVIVRVLWKVISGSGVDISAGAIVKTFGGTIRYIENEASLFIDRQIRISETRKDFVIITTALGKGTDSVARNCYNFCMRVHHLPDTEQKFIFMANVNSLFRRDWVGAIQRFSRFEEEMVERYFGEFRGI